MVFNLGKITMTKTNIKETIKNLKRRVWLKFINGYKTITTKKILTQILCLPTKIKTERVSRSQ
jgi:hypothetical protein